MEAKACIEAAKGVVKVMKACKSEKTKTVSLLSKGTGFSTLNFAGHEFRGRTFNREGVRRWLARFVQQIFPMPVDLL